jgi:hypothetical protein
MLSDENQRESFKEARRQPSSRTQATSSKLYESIPITVDEIRLLEIVPIQPDQSSADHNTIHCHLSKTRFDASTTYRAISYCWGDPDVTSPIIVNGFEVQVTVNLAAVLRQLREWCVGVKLWVDALCINQSDDVEKSQQVNAMGRVYFNSSETYVWLGEQDDDSDKSFNLIRKWTEHEEGSEKNPLLFAKLADSPKDYVKRFFTLHDYYFDEFEWIALNRFMDRPYWHRIWTYQETILSPNLTVVCGPKTMNWNDFELARVEWHLCLTAEYPKMSMLPQFKEIISMKNSLSHRFVDHSSRHLNLGAREPLDFLKMLRHTYGLKSYDPRDRVFALLGLNEGWQFDIKADYSKSVEEVYFEATVASMHPPQGLSILYDAGIGGKSYDPQIEIPSWVPNYRSSHDREGPEELWDDRATGLTEGRGYQHKIDGKVLEVLGVAADTISHVTTPESLQGWIELPLRELTLQDPLATHQTGIPMYQAYLRLLTPETLRKYSKPAASQSSESHLDFFAFAAGFMYSLGRLRWYGQWSSISEVPGIREIFNSFPQHIPIYTRLFALWTGFTPDPPSEQGWLEPLFGTVNNSLQKQWQSVMSDLDLVESVSQFLHCVAFHEGKCFFLTAGGYIGIGPPGTGVDDQIWVLPGRTYPLAVRKVRGRSNHQLVGPCAVYGMMDKEIDARVADGSARVEWLSLE